jgi:hypothetical protein
LEEGRLPFEKELIKHTKWNKKGIVQG